MIATSLTITLDEPMDLTEQLNQFFMAHEKKAYAIAVMSLKHKDDALDVVQDVMIKFVEKYKNKKCELWTPLFLSVSVSVSVNTQSQLDWHDLNFKQQKLLLPFESEWNGMDAKTREKLINNTNKWLSMTPEEQKLSHQKLNKLKQLPAVEQQRIKRRVEQFKNQEKINLTSNDISVKIEYRCIKLIRKYCAPQRLMEIFFC